MIKLAIWCVGLVLLVISVVGMVALTRTQKPAAPIDTKKKVHSWSGDRYHFVNMRSTTDEVYTMICDRFTGIESLLAKAYRYPRKDSRDGGSISTMTSIHMGFNPDCLNRDIWAYETRGRESSEERIQRNIDRTRREMDAAVQGAK